MWGMGNSFRDSEPLESLHLKFIKETIGVNYKACNSACRSELNRLPMKTKIQISIIKFWDHIIYSNNTLVHKIYLTTENNNLWVKNLMGFECLNLNPTNLTFDLGQIQMRIKDLASQEQDSFITNSPELEFFVKCIKLGKGLHMYCRCVQTKG